jgi:hypothetical protein
MLMAGPPAIAPPGAIPCGRIARGTSAARTFINVLTGIAVAGLMLLFSLIAIFVRALGGEHAGYFLLLALLATAVAISFIQAKRADALDLLSRAEFMLMPQSRVAAGRAGQLRAETVVSAREMSRILLEMAADAALGPLRLAIVGSIVVLSVLWILGVRFGHPHFAGFAAFAAVLVVIGGLVPYIALRACLSTQFQRILDAAAVRTGAVEATTLLTQT